jgi:hypothetical protein
MQAQVAAATAGGDRVVEHFSFDQVKVRLLIPFGVQSGFSLGLDATGTVVRASYSASGELRQQASEPFSRTFALRRATGDRWLLIGTFAPGESP